MEKKLSTKKRLLFTLYIVLYLPWFFYLEKTITMDSPNIHIMNTTADELIPFCEYFIIPYVLWFFYIIVASVHLLMKASDVEFVRYAMSLIIGMSISLFICMIYPNGLTLRPENASDGICGDVVRMLWMSDTPTNVFPSIHVYDSLAICIGLHRDPWIRQHKLVDLSSFILCVLICLATVFLKQHSILDVIGAFVLMGILYFFIYCLNYKEIFKRDDSKKEIA